MHYRSTVKVWPVILILWLFGVHAEAQTIAGIKFGGSVPFISPENILVMDHGVPYYEISVADTKYGLHAGLFLQSQMGHFFIEPELVYNASTVDYNLDSLGSPEAGNARITDKYRYLNLPLLMGFKAGAFRIGAGPVGHMFISADNGFKDYADYSPDFEKFTWGWQGGIGFDFWKLHFDFRYESNYSTFGDYMTFFGKSYDFATDNDRLIGSAALSF